MNDETKLTDGEARPIDEHTELGLAKLSPVNNIVVLLLRVYVFAMMGLFLYKFIVTSIGH